MILETTNKDRVVIVLLYCKTVPTSRLSHRCAPAVGSRLVSLCATGALDDQRQFVKCLLHCRVHIVDVDSPVLFILSLHGTMQN